MPLNADFNNIEGNPENNGIFATTQNSTLQSFNLYLFIYFYFYYFQVGGWGNQIKKEKHYFVMGASFVAWTYSNTQFKNITV